MNRNQRRNSLPGLLGCGALILYYLVLALQRRIDADEGYFLLAARLVRQGRVPYADFFFPQLPLIPYLWGYLLHPAGLNWLSARVLAAGMAVLSAGAFWSLARRRVAGGGVALALQLTYLTTDMGLEWAVVVKAFGPAMLFMLLAWAAASRTLEPDRGGKAGRAWAFCGFSGGLALLTRLTVLPVVLLMPAVLLWSARRSGRNGAWRQAACWLAGLLPALLVLGWFWHHAPLAFVYDNWRYHALGAPPTLAARLRENARVALEVVALNPLWILALALTAWNLVRRRASPQDAFYLLALAAMCAVSFVPIQSYHQYYCLATPWLLLAAAPGLEEAWLAWGRPLWRRRRATALLGALALGGLLAWAPYQALERRWPQWTRHPRTPEAREEFDNRLGTVRAVGRRIDALAPAGARLLTWWPGYALECRTPLLEGLENHFGLRVGQLEPGRALARRGGVLHTLAPEDVDRAIAKKEAGIVVAGIWAEHGSGRHRAALDEALREAGYTLRDRVGEAAIYVDETGMK